MPDDDLQLDDDPYRTFDGWFAAAQASVPQAEAMSLATVDANGAPSQRIVLYKGRSDGGFRFFTNYQSRKSADIGRNVNGALLFFWQRLTRQIRIDGKIEQLSRAESEEYFASRDRESQLGAWASAQSDPLESRAALMAELDVFRTRYDGRDVPCPPHWGGYRLQPLVFEFWQGRESRLHDRFVYRRESRGWRRERLAP